MNGDAMLPLEPPAGDAPRHAAARSADREEERRARAAWSRLAEPCDAVATRLLREVGAVRALEAVRTRPESALDRFRPRLAELDVDADLAAARRVGARLVVPGDPEWPPGLDDLQSPPYCLWVRGPADLAAAARRSIAIVGARTSTAYGERMASEIAAGLAERGVAVFSGAAFGIDAAGHRGALAVGGTTVAVLAGGVDRPSPAAHDRLLGHIAETGAVVAECPPGAPPLRSRFLRRNRILAAATQGTLVAEAGLRSGSRNTAGTASELGRVVLALPGPVTSMVSAGCHQMIRSGMAILVTDTDEVVEALAPIGAAPAPDKRGGSRPEDDLDEDEARVLDVLGSRARPAERVAASAGVSYRRAATVLGRLELSGHVVATDGGWRRAPRGTRAARPA